jgi:cytochrome P450
VRSDRAAEGSWPPGETSFSMARTRHFEHDPKGLLVSSYQRYGPVFTLKIFHHNAVFMLGPAANHYMLVSHASNFLWRDGHMRDLIPLLGDGLLTIDGLYHRTHRKLMLPAFHRERIEAASVAMREEVDRALEQLIPDTVVNLYDWTRSVALRIALRALFGFDPDVAQAGGFNAAAEFESALSFYSRDYLLQILRGPGTPYARMLRSRDRLDGLIYGEIDRRRASGERGEDILSLLLDAEAVARTPAVRVVLDDPGHDYYSELHRLRS